ncbi:MAG TPA: fibronectin type III domain-containing protein [Flavipsychrobacter sp.]|nr:fibronectin type III domain-containing protein [Flavipsychrobacter sp.]
MSTVALKLDRRNAPDLIQFGRNIHAKMLASATLFATPPVTMADLASALDGLETAQQNTYGAGKSAILIRNEKLAEVKSLLKDLGIYVQMVSKGDDGIIDLAGMPVKSKGPRRYDFLAVPTGLTAFVLRSGVIGLRWRRIHNAKSFVIEYCPDPITDGGWKPGMTNSGANGRVENLTPGKTYWFRVRAIGSDGLTSDWTVPVCQMVL